MSRDWAHSNFGPKTALCVMAAAPELSHWTDAFAEVDRRLAEALDLLQDHFTPVLTEPA